MTEPADQPVAPRKGRSLTGFYVAIGVVVALALFGFWFWRSWTVWWFDADEAKRRQVDASAKLGVPVEKTVDLGDGVKLELVLIPPGRFRMGDQAGEEDTLSCGHQWVRITKPFYMGKYEVTQEQWEKVMGSTPSHFKGARNPVEYVSWDDCRDFLKKLNGLGKASGPFRLPTEAEWEWACRAGTRTWYCFGDDEGSLGDYAWNGDNTGDATHLVGEKKPNAWGLYDMHGNVWEWCGDWYEEEYSRGWMPKVNPTGPVTGAGRVLRGGSWMFGAGNCLSAGRIHGSHPADRGADIGFRLVTSSSRTP